MSHDASRVLGMVMLVLAACGGDTSAETVSGGPAVDPAQGAAEANALAIDACEELAGCWADGTDNPTST